MVKSILNRAYYKQVAKRLQGKTLYYYIQECLSFQDFKMILQSPHAALPSRSRRPQSVERLL